MRSTYRIAENSRKGDTVILIPDNPLILDEVHDLFPQNDYDAVIEQYISERRAWQHPSPIIVIYRKGTDEVENYIQDGETLSCGEYEHLASELRSLLPDYEWMSLDNYIRNSCLAYFRESPSNEWITGNAMDMLGELTFLKRREYGLTDINLSTWDDIEEAASRTVEDLLVNALACEKAKQAVAHP